MHIKEFKEGDILTRSQSNELGDRSYKGDKLEFVGIEAGMIVLIEHDPYSDNSYCLVKLQTDLWSEDWDYFPENLIQKAKLRIKNLLKR